MAENNGFRKQKAMFLRDPYRVAFEDLAYAQKRAGGKTAPELSEEAIKLLLEHYGVNTSNLPEVK